MLHSFSFALGPKSLLTSRSPLPCVTWSSIPPRLPSTKFVRPSTGNTETNCHLKFYPENKHKIMQSKSKNIFGYSLERRVFWVQAQLCSSIRSEVLSFSRSCFFFFFLFFFLSLILSLFPFFLLFSFFFSFFLSLRVVVLSSNMALRYLKNCSGDIKRVVPNYQSFISTLNRRSNHLLCWRQTQAHGLPLSSDLDSMFT